MNNFELKVFCGSSNQGLAEKIASYLGVALGAVNTSKFPDSETYARFMENIRGRDVFLIQSLSMPVNDNLMELLVMLDAAKRASAARITAVIPYFAYSRQDRKAASREPITAKLVADLLSAAGADRVITMDLHAAQLQGFFDVPVDHLYASPVIINYFKEKRVKDLILVAPDVGGVKLARAYCKKLGAELAIIDKRRVAAEQTEVQSLIGNVAGKNALIVDDVISTAGTIKEAVAFLSNSGVNKVFVAATHAVLAGSAIERLKQSKIYELILTDTIHLPEEKKLPNMKLLSVSEMFGEAIKRIHGNESVSSLFE